jgi:hypothetical protein
MHIFFSNYIVGDHTGIRILTLLYVYQMSDYVGIIENQEFFYMTKQTYRCKIKEVKLKNSVASPRYKLEELVQNHINTQNFYSSVNWKYLETVTNTIKLSTSSIYIMFSKDH